MNGAAHRSQPPGNASPIRHPRNQKLVLTLKTPSTEPPSIAEREALLAARLRSLRGAPERLNWLIAEARQIPPFPEHARTADALVPGCLSQLWLQGRFAEGRCTFRCDSDSTVVKALAVTLCRLFDHATPAAILATPTDFLARSELRHLLTSNRQDALRRVWARIRSFAAEHQMDLGPPPRT